MKLTYFTDPTHAWLKVPEKVLLNHAPGIINKISRLSYHVAGVAVYLEKDRDAPLFLAACQETPVIKEAVVIGIWKYSSYRPEMLGAKVGSKYTTNAKGTWMIIDNRSAKDWAIMHKETGKKYLIRKTELGDFLA